MFWNQYPTKNVMGMTANAVPLHLPATKEWGNDYKVLGTTATFRNKQIPDPNTITLVKPT